MIQIFFCSVHLKEEARDFLEPETIKDLVKKYSQFINFNIYLWTSKTEEVEEPVEEEATTEDKKADESAEDKKEEKDAEKEEEKKDDEKEKEDKDDDVEVEEESEEKEKKPKTKKVCMLKLNPFGLYMYNVDDGNSPQCFCTFSISCFGQAFSQGFKSGSLNLQWGWLEPTIYNTKSAQAPGYPSGKSLVLGELV